jgi:transcriptional regulator with PAS, ATPase and Fis domain
VLLVGESGVGKEVLATRIHERSPRRSGPFLRINVAAIADGMLEAELFGSVRGAFTDARRDRVGLLASANGGTMLLDEIGECRPEIQAKLLRVIETQTYFPVGSDEERVVDVRLLGATNRPPADVLAGGPFRTDLLFRFGTVITIPPLRERKSEIMPLAESFAAQAGAEMGKGPFRFSRAARDALEAYDWPGNVRELKHAVEHAVLLAERTELTPELFELRAQRTVVSTGGMTATLGLADTRATTERAEILSALHGAGGSATAAARKLGVARSTLYEKLKKYGLR